MTGAHDEPPSPAGAACGPASLVIAFGSDGNSDAFVGEGWYAAEPGHRWTRGPRSELRLPALAPSPRFALTLDCLPVGTLGLRQTLEVEINGVALGGVLAPNAATPTVIEVPGAIVSATGENRLVFRQPRALAPAPHSRDGRTLAFMWRRLLLAPDFTTLFAGARTLPEVDVDEHPAAEIAARFQSLGQNGEFGAFQRLCGAEPRGLLRFADIDPEVLVIGLETRFADIADPGALAFLRNVAGEWFVDHAIYGLRYPIASQDGETDFSGLRDKEARRLGALARLLMEEIAGDEKIFVRRGGFETEAELLKLWRLLQSYNSRARLLAVRAAPRAEPGRAGRVERLAPHLYRGFLTGFADPRRLAATLAYAQWLNVCAALDAHERASRRGAAAP